MRLRLVRRLSGVRVVGLIRLLIVVRIVPVLAFTKGESRERKEKGKKDEWMEEKERRVICLSISAGQIDGFGFYLLVTFNVITYDLYLGGNG
jgi:hypothetical protein